MSSFIRYERQPPVNMAHCISFIDGVNKSSRYVITFRMMNLDSVTWRFDDRETCEEVYDKLLDTMCSYPV